MRNLDELINPYEGPNEAHKGFRSEFKYLNALYFVVVTGKEELRQQLQRRMSQAEANSIANGRGGNYALGVVTRAISNTQFEGVYVAKVEAESMSANFDGFISLLCRHCIIAAHRALIDFVTDLLIELSDRSRIQLNESTEAGLRDRRLSPNKLAKTYEGIGVPLTTSPQYLRRLHVLGVTRNILEHNSGRATEEYLQLTGSTSLAVGDRILVTSAEVGSAFWLIEWVAARLNEQVLKQFNLNNL